MNTQDTLLAYSEWLDTEGLLKIPAVRDGRSHEDLAREFVEQWEAPATRAPLAGREGVYANVPREDTLPGFEAEENLPTAEEMLARLKEIQATLTRPPFGGIVQHDTSSGFGL